MSTEKLLAFGTETFGKFSFLSENGLIENSKEYGHLNNFESFNSYYSDIKKIISANKYDSITFICDMHPDYVTTVLAEEFLKKFSNSKLIKIQHHFAHFASVMYENDICGKCAGAIFDGTGYGLDGLSWGGEFIICENFNFERVMHFEYIEQPGADAVISEPWRMACSYLIKNNLTFSEFEKRIGFEKI